MRRSVGVAVVAVAGAAGLLGTHDGVCRTTRRGEPEPLDAYTAVVGEPAELQTIAEQGIEVSGQERSAGGVELDAVSTSPRRTSCGKGISLELTRVRGKTVREFAAEQAANGFTVWRSYDEPGGIRDQLYAAARDNPQLVQAQVSGTPARVARSPAVKLTQRRSGHTGRCSSGRPLQLRSTPVNGSRPRSTGG